MYFFSKLLDQYQELWKAIIRPPRDDYNIGDLGPSLFPITVGPKKRRMFQRKDCTLVNRRGLKLACSHFEPIDEQRTSEKLPVVIYMHGNCSSRIEALVCLQLLLPLNITVFAFDFAGCGQSGGEYVSLGWYERDDLAVVIEHLRQSNRTSCIGLWGRSMGAVTALLHGDRDPSIAAMVLDSPFSNLRKLAEELVDGYVAWRLPKFLVSTAMSMLRSTILHRAHFDIDLLSPIDHVDKTFIPAMFIGAEDDKFILPHHAKELALKYAGDIILKAVEGDHNSIRPVELQDGIAMFFHQTLQCDKIQPDRLTVETLWPMTFSVISARSRRSKRMIVDERSAMSSRKTSPRPDGDSNPQPTSSELSKDLRYAVGTESLLRHDGRAPAVSSNSSGGSRKDEHTAEQMESHVLDEERPQYPTRHSVDMSIVEGLGGLQKEEGFGRSPQHRRYRPHITGEPSSEDGTGRCRRADDMRPPDRACFFTQDEDGNVQLVEAWADSSDEEEAQLQSAIRQSLLEYTGDSSMKTDGATDSTSCSGSSSSRSRTKVDTSRRGSTARVDGCAVSSRARSSSRNSGTEAPNQNGRAACSSHTSSDAGEAGNRSTDNGGRSDLGVSESSTESKRTEDPGSSRRSSRSSSRVPTKQ